MIAYMKHDDGLGVKRYGQSSRVQRASTSCTSKQSHFAHGQYLIDIPMNSPPEEDPYHKSESVELLQNAPLTNLSPDTSTPSGTCSGCMGVRLAA